MFTQTMQITKVKDDQKKNTSGKDYSKTTLLEETLLTKRLSVQEDPKQNRSLFCGSRLWRKSKIRDLSLRNEGVSVSGWVHRKRSHRRELLLIIRDGTGFLHCIVPRELSHRQELLDLTVESTISVQGEVGTVPENKTALGSHTMLLEDFQIYHLAPRGREAFEQRLNEETDIDTLFNQRHLFLRWKKPAIIMVLRSELLHGFRNHYHVEGYVEVTPPCLVSSRFDRGSTIFQLDYHEEEAYLTQTSQFYLETVCPSLGDVYCIQEAFQAETSQTRQHLAECTRIESECPFIGFEELLTKIEELICNVISTFLNGRYEKTICEVNPEMKVPQQPFIRMTYIEALDWLRRNQIWKDDWKYFEFGDPIPEIAERRLVNCFARPIFLTHFPIGLKAFDTLPDPECKEVGLGVVLLLPGAGEILRGSMREENYEALLNTLKNKGLPAENYYWYLDQRKYGTFPHGGYGLDFERFLGWLLGLNHIRDTSLYPRYIGHCGP